MESELADMQFLIQILQLLIYKKIHIYSCANILIAYWPMCKWIFSKSLIYNVPVGLLANLADEAINKDCFYNENDRRDHDEREYD